MKTETETTETVDQHVATSARAVVDALAATQDQRARLHRVALAVLEALEAGAEVRDLVGAVADLTAPPVAPPQPETRFLPLTLEEFEMTGAALLLWEPKGQVALWLAADEAAAERVESWITTRRQVRRTDWARQELARAGVPEAEWTVRRLAEVLGAVIREVR